MKQKNENTNNKLTQSKVVDCSRKIQQTGLSSAASRLDAEISSSPKRPVCFGCGMLECAAFAFALEPNERFSRRAALLNHPTRGSERKTREHPGKLRSGIPMGSVEIVNSAGERPAFSFFFLILKQTDRFAGDGRFCCGPACSALSGRFKV